MNLGKIKKYLLALGIDVHRTFAYPVPMVAHWMRQFRYLTKRFDSIAMIDGDIVECGVGGDVRF